MNDDKTSKQPSPPWQGDTSFQPSQAEIPAAKPEEQPIELSIHGLAAELKNSIRSDRVRRSKQD